MKVDDLEGLPGEVLELFIRAPGRESRWTVAVPLRDAFVAGSSVDAEYPLFDKLPVMFFNAGWSQCRRVSDPGPGRHSQVAGAHNLGYVHGTPPRDRRIRLMSTVFIHSWGSASSSTGLGFPAWLLGRPG